MPRIPIYEPRTSAVTPIPDLTRESDDGIAQGLGALGAGLQRLSETIDLVNQRDAATESAKALSDLRVASVQRFLEAQQAAAPDATNFTPDVLKGFDADLSKALSGSKSKLAAVAIRQRSVALREDLATQALSFEANTRNAYRVSSIEQSADRLRSALQLDPDSWQSAGAEQLAAIEALQLPPQARLELSRRVDAQLREAAALGYAKRDPRGVLAEIGKEKSTEPLFEGLPYDSRNRIEQQAKGQLVQQSVTGVMSAYERAGAEAGVRALAATQASDLPADLKDDVRAHVNEQVSQLRTQRRQERAQDLAGIESSIATNTAGQTTRQRVDALYAAGALAPSEYANYHGQIDASVMRRAQGEAFAAEVWKALAEGVPLDPRNTDHRKALAGAFAQDVVGEPVGSATWQATAEAYAQRTRMLPDQALAWTRQAMRSPDPKLAAQAAQFYGMVNAAAPDAVSQIDDDTRAFAGVVNDMIEGGTDPARAVETARVNMFDVKPEVRKQRESTFSQQHVKNQAGALNSRIDRDFDPGLLSRQPAASVALSTDFDAQALRYFTKVGDIDLARDLAWADIKRVYGPTRVNGEPVVIAFPPERFGVTPEDIRTDIGNFLKSNPQADGSTAADVTLVPDALTLRAVGDVFSGRLAQPSYKLVTKGGDLLLDRHGVPIRYTLPRAEELAARFRAAQEKASAEAKAMVDQARFDRQTQEQFRKMGSGAGVHR
jgi:hypothetical protein